MTAEIAIQEFVKRVRTLHEPDYGDFKRMVKLYLSRLEQELKTSPESKRALAEIRTHLIYDPNGQVEATRRYLVDRCAQMMAAPKGAIT